MNDYLREDSWRLVVGLVVVIGLLAGIYIVEQRLHTGAKLITPLLGD